MKIKVLPPLLADKIAAGEVVERPASVVKELVENSLDAGAHNISVEIKRGGITFIRVTDDGCGMTPEDAKTSYLRHATSKIEDADDLNCIGTYGFRGEALAAISAVSRMEIITATKSASSAFYLSLEAGKVLQEDEIGAPSGTSVIVRDLFFNTPARLHFMKRDATEAAAVASVLEKIAIARYDVSFTLTSDQRVILRTTKSNDMRNAIHAIFGHAISDSLLKVDFDHQGYGISGYVCKPKVTRSNRNMQLTFLNRRFIKSKIIFHAIDEAYKTVRETGSYPVCFLNFTFDPSDVDVNVHPAKLEAKFRDEKALIVLTKYGILNALEAEKPFVPIPLDDFDFDAAIRPKGEPYFIGNEVTGYFLVSDDKNDDDDDDELGIIIVDDPEDEGLSENSEGDDTVIEGQRSEEEEEFDFSDPDVAAKYGYVIMPSSSKVDSFEGKSSVTNHYEPFSAKFSSEKERVAASEGTPSVLPTFFDMDPIGFVSDDITEEIRVLGELFKVYFVLEYRDTLYLVDKHAAHEKMIYNDLLNQVAENNNVSAQMLISPIVLPLAAEDMNFVLENSLEFYRSGFDFFESGPDCLSLTAIPTIFSKESPTELFLDLLESVRNFKSGATDRQEKFLKTVACRAAIKGGSTCSDAEIVQLVSRLIEGKDLNYCPHGRPVIQSFTHKEIDKMFKRVK